MAFYDKFPYTNFQELNLDKIAERIESIDASVEEAAEQAAAAKTSANAAGTSAGNAATSAATAANAATSASNSAARAETLASGINNLQAQIDVERARIDQFTELAEGSTTGDAELADGRVGYDGITYQNIGSAIRGQIGNLYKMDATLNDETEIFPVLHYGFINPSTLLINESGTTHQYSDPIFIPAGHVLHVPRVNKSTSTALLTECSSGGTNTKLIMKGFAGADSDGSMVSYPFISDTWVRIGTRNDADLNAYKHFYITKLGDYVLNAENHKELLSHLNVTYSSGPITDGGVQTGSAYEHSTFITVPKGFTIEYWSSGSANNHAITVYDPMDNVIGEVYGNSRIMHEQFVMPAYGRIRFSARVHAPTDSNSVILPPEKLYGWNAYYKPNHNHERADCWMFGKKICAIGDSLIYGNALGPGATWLPTIAFKYNSTPVNLGANGGTIAQLNNEEVGSVYERLNLIPEDADYIIVLGGANDKRLRAQLGAENSTDPSTFNGALNLIAEQLRTEHPKAKIIFMSTYWRYASLNSLGLGDKDYAEAMLKAAERNHIPHFDNFTQTGINFVNDAMRGWLDESRDRQQNVGGEIVYYNDTHHFSVEGYDWLVPIYEQRLKEL